MLKNLTESLKKTEDTSIVLNQITVCPLSDPLWDKIAELYRSPNVILRIVGSILNSSRTQNLPCFIMSRKLLNNLIKDDKYVACKSVNSSVYKKLLSLLLEKESGFQVVYTSSNFNDRKKRAMLLEIVDNDVLIYYSNVDARKQEVQSKYKR